MREPDIGNEPTPPATPEQERIDAWEYWHQRAMKFEAALVAIRDHWACQYDHPRKLSEMYSGPYGIGVTDGHRCAADIARKALSVD